MPLPAAKIEDNTFGETNVLYLPLSSSIFLYLQRKQSFRNLHYYINACSGSLGRAPLAATLTGLLPKPNRVIVETQQGYLLNPVGLSPPPGRISQGGKKGC